MSTDPTAPAPCPDCGQSTRAGDVHTCSPAAPHAGPDFDTPLAADEAFYLRDTDPRNDLISRDVGEAKEWMDEFAPEIVRRVRILPVAEAVEHELRIRLDERRSFGPLVQRIAEDAARRTLEKIEEVADIVKRERPFLPPCVVEDIRDAAGWARETAEAERERAADESLPSMTRSVSRECAAKYDRLAKIAELHLEGRPQPEAVTEARNITCECERGPREAVKHTDDAGVSGWTLAAQCSDCLEEAALRATQEGR